MVKNKRNIFILLLLSPILLSSCFNSTDEKKLRDDIIGKKQPVIEDIKELEIKNEINYEDLRSKITLDDINLMNAWINIDEENKILLIWKTFLDKLEKYDWDSLTDNINWGKSIDFLNESLSEVPKELIRHFYVKISAYDSETKAQIQKWTVYINSIKLWDFDNWVFKWEFNWVKWIEDFNIIVRSELYWDAMTKLNSLNSEWSLISTKLYMKKAIIKDVIIWEKQTIKAWTTSIILSKCNLVWKDWNCFEWKAELKVNNISWNEANNFVVSTNRTALTKEWKIVTLQSWWMAYIDFLDKDWNILKLKDWETITITYKVSQEDIDLMANKLWWEWEKEWYWWYDKNKWLRIESSAQYFVNKRNKTFKTKITNLY